jgi:hypothetical protein
MERTLPDSSAIRVFGFQILGRLDVLANSNLDVGESLVFGGSL